MAGPGFNQALALQVAVGLEHGIGVDGRRRDDLPHRGELVARIQQAHPQGLPDLLDDLQVRGYHRPAVDPEADHVASSSMSYVTKTLDRQARTVNALSAGRCRAYSCSHSRPRDVAAYVKIAV
jgi:hypothetical protein